MANYKRRLDQFKELLSADVINIEDLRRICMHGIPDELGIRSLCWKLLLGYLPPEHATWRETLEMRRRAYDNFVQDVVTSPALRCDQLSGDVSPSDHPLNPSPDSKWQTFFQDNDILLQIDKDVRRLCPDIAFFQRETEYPCLRVVSDSDVERLHKRVQFSALKAANVTRRGLGVTTQISMCRRKASEEYAPLLEGQEAHWEVVERLLFIYAKLNPGQGYVQGMNEIIGPLYYTFASDACLEWREHAEADCFFCFTNLMAETRDFFIKILDDSESGISGMMQRLSDQVKRLDYGVWHHLNALEVKPQFYSFRWLTLLLSQEFPLPDVIRIWDSLFADANRFDFLLDVCCAMHILIRSQILNGDFPACMKLLQNYPQIDIKEVLSLAMHISKKDQGTPT